MTQTKPTQGATRWAAFLVALLVVGPMNGWIVSRIAPEPGAIDGTALVTPSPVIGVVAVVMCALLATILGVIAARAVSVGLGLVCAGVAMAWAAFHTGHLPGLVRAVEPAALARTLTIEGAIVGLVTLGAAICIARRGWPDERLDIRAMFSGTALAGGAVAAIAGMAAAWVIAQDDKPGQTVAAAFAAGAVGAAVARTVVHGAPRSCTLLAIPIGAVLCPLVGFMATSSPQEPAILGGAVSPWARIMPFDWCAGMLIGLPLGLSWAGSMIEKSHAKATPAASQPRGPVSSAS